MGRGKGRPKDWTLEELKLIWEHDGSDGLSTAEHSEKMGVSYSTWYSIKSRLRDAGGPEALYERMQEDKKGRYNRAAGPLGTRNSKKPDTLEDALRRVYTFRSSPAGRSGKQPQYSVTIPPLLALPFIQKYGDKVVFEPRPDGILLKPLVAPPLPEIPDWVKGDSDEGSNS